MFNVSEEQFSVLYGGKSKKFKVYKKSPSEEIHLKRPDNLFSPSLLLFTFQVNAKSNDSIVDKHRIGQGKTIGIRVRFSDCLRYMHDEGNLIPAEIIGFAMY